MATVRISGNAKLINADKQATDYQPKQFKVWEKVYQEKRDGTVFEINRLWVCWFEQPVDLKLNDMDGETWVEVEGEYSSKIGSYTKDGVEKQVIDRNLNKCRILQKKEPNTLDQAIGFDVNEGISRTQHVTREFTETAPF